MTTDKALPPSVWTQTTDLVTSDCRAQVAGRDAGVGVGVKGG